jgi:protein-S-isoprenylcysteine O-methyltransferase Ste14
MDTDVSAPADPAHEQPAAPAEKLAGRRTTMLPERRERPPLESAFVRVVATGGVVGIGVALAAILASQNVEGWIIGLVVALVSVILSAILWSSRRL